jgi:hypothetical protein
VPEHHAVWSPSLVRCVFDSCSQLDSLWKLRRGRPGKVTIADHFAAHATVVSREWVIVWDGEGVERQPFSAWQGTYAPLSWWQAYNNLKHNRWENVKEATVAHAVDAAAALFIAIANDPACHTALAERKWIYSYYASDYLLAKLSRPERILGVTIESKLFSYAVCCSHNSFTDMLAHFRGSSRRFGKWLEAKYGREFWIAEERP